MKIIKHEFVGNRRLILTSEDGVATTEYISTYLRHDCCDAWFRVPDFRMVSDGTCTKINKSLLEFFAHEDYYARKKNDA